MSSVDRVQTWSAQALRSVEGVATSFDPAVVASICASARRAEQRFLASEDYEFNSVFADKPSPIVSSRLAAEYEFQDAISAYVHLASEDTDVLMLFVAYTLFYGDSGFLRAMQIHLRHSLDAVHFVMVGCEFIQLVSGSNYLLELEHWCPRIVLPATIEKFVASVEKLPRGPRTYTAKYLQLPPNERKATSPWAMMRAELLVQ